MHWIWTDRVCWPTYKEQQIHWIKYAKSRDRNKSNTMILFLFSIFNMKKLFSIVSPPTFHLAPRSLKWIQIPLKSRKFFGLICNCLNFNYHCDDHIFIWKKKIVIKVFNLTDSRQFTISAATKWRLTAFESWQWKNKK